MLNRRILRIKAFKVLYSYAENQSMSLKEAESQLEISCRATRDLYLFMLAIISPLTAEAAERIRAAREKFNPTEEERNPNMKFAENALAKYFDDDPDFRKIIGRLKLSWDQYDVLIRKTYESIRTKDWYAEYMASPERSLKEDCKLFEHIFEEEFVDSSELEEILEDLSLYWTDDLAYALSWCCHSLEELSRGKGWTLLPLYKSEMSAKSGVDSDKAFVTKLLRTAFAGFAQYSAKVAETVPKWDKERLFTTDMVLIVCGLAEAKAFPEIPIKVTINEYVEISKYYGTPKSRSFVNGLLDKLIREMLESGEIVKAGRGLM